MIISFSALDSKSGPYGALIPTKIVLNFSKHPELCIYLTHKFGVQIMPMAGPIGLTVNHDKSLEASKLKSSVKWDREADVANDSDGHLNELGLQLIEDRVQELIDKSKKSDIYYLYQLMLEGEERMLDCSVRGYIEL